MNLTKFLTHLIRVYTYHNDEVCGITLYICTLFIFNMPFSSFVLLFLFVYVGVNFLFVGYAFLEYCVCICTIIFYSRGRYMLHMMWKVSCVYTTKYFSVPVLRTKTLGLVLYISLTILCT